MTKIYFIAGEASGDQLGGSVMQGLKAIAGPSDTLHFSGIGGQQMSAQGLASLFPMTDLSIMGLVEVIKHFPLLYKRFHQTVDNILEINPDVLVTIDAPDFGLRVARKIRKLRPQIRLVHYVAPTVWAWRPGRAKKIAGFLDGLICLFPFEPTYFTRHGLQAAFVGHPLSHEIQPVTPEQKREFCQKHGLNPDGPILCVLPGSRRREIDSLLPVISESVQRLKRQIPGLQIIIPTLPHLVEQLKPLAGLAHLFVPNSQAEKFTAFAVSTAALHASGTVALELALCGTPMVTIYKMNTLTAWIAKRVIKTPFANLVNILLQREVVPELLQEKANPDSIVSYVNALLTQPAAQAIQRNDFKKIAALLQEPQPHAAAHFILTH